MSKRPDAGVAGPDAEPGPDDAGPQTLAEALELRRNARVGLAAGLGLAGLLYVPTYLAVGATVVGAGGYYLGLALVFAATVAGVVTAGLCGKTMLEPVLDRRAWLRRGGTAALVGGAAWALVPAVAWLHGAGEVPHGYRVAATSLSALALLVGTVGLHVAVRDGGGHAGGWSRRIERVAYWIVVLGLALAAGNATGDPGPVGEVAGTTLPTPFLTSTFLALAAAVPFAATAELAGVLPSRRLRALQLGALASTIGVAWLFALGGWPWLQASVADLGGGAPEAAALALVTVPAGVGWAIAGHGLRSLASRPPRDEAGSEDAAIGGRK